MTKQLIMAGGVPLVVGDAVVRAGGAGAGGMAPLVYGHGPGAVGQLVTNSLQAASLWGDLESLAIC